jgi:hypothetical protein
MPRLLSQPLFNKSTTEKSKMKLNIELTEQRSEGGAAGPPEPMQGSGNSIAPARAGVPKRLRRLKSNELVSRGDFVANERQGFELWEGPTGFRADSFVKTIYRCDDRPH